jgi:hypothetical protein
MTPLNLGSRRELFVDRLLIDRLNNTQLKLHEPVAGGVAIRGDKPWEGPGSIGISVIDAGDRLLMYYRSCPAIIGDEIKRVVAWKQGTDVSRLAGRPVRLRFVMKDADLFALRFR